MPIDRRLTRRTFTLSVLGVGSTCVLASCDAVDVPHRQQASEEPDADLVRVALAAEKHALMVCRVAAHRERSLRRILAQPERFHAEHVRLLESGTSSTAKSQNPHVPVGLAPALDAVVAAERRLVRQHANASMKARSGEVARLLAGLSAAAAQQERVLGSVDVR